MYNQALINFLSQFAQKRKQRRKFNKNNPMLVFITANNVEI